MLSSVAVSPAANRWQLGLIHALQEIGVAVSVIGHLPEPAWPRGRLRVKSQAGRLPAGIQGQLTDYWNLTVWRNRSLGSGYRKLVREIGAPRTPPGIVITYNSSPANAAGATFARKRYGMPWVCIVADGEAPADADGYVFLTWGYYEAFAGLKPKLHLDGGVSEIRLSAKVPESESPSARQVVMYTGALTRHGGADFLARAFHQIDNPGMELWICGKGANPEVERLSAIDTRIKVMGLLPERELQRLAQQADVFVNPRPSNLSINGRNFPSKVLEYLSYGRPVISTWTAGLSPEYRSVLIVLERETEKCLASTIQEVLKWDLVQQKSMAERITLFVKGHSWSAQTSRLIHWLDREIWSVQRA